MSTAGLVDLIRSDETIIWTQGAAEPTELLEDLLARRHEVGPFRAFLGAGYVGTVRPEHADLVEMIGMGGVGTNRAICRADAMEIVPCHLSDLPRLLADGTIAVDVVVLQLSEDERGELSYGAVNGYVQYAARRARLVVAEINDQAPWTHSREPVDRQLIDVTFRTSRPLVELPPRESGEVDREIACHLATFIEDGSILQLGIGGVPNAIAALLGDRRDLGLHTGVVGDGLVELIESGAITNATKPEERGKSVTGGLLGSRRVYDFVDRNPDVLVEPVSYTHARSVLAGLPSLVCVNSAIEVDLTGQVGAEVAGGSYLGTIGGHADFVRGALASVGGRSLIGLPARTGRDVPRIVSRLTSGVVTGLRADADVVATEYGVAELRGRTIRERVRRMIAIAHPEDREGLERAAFDHVAGYR